jgi:hypothetical protein
LETVEGFGDSGKLWRRSQSLWRRSKGLEAVEGYGDGQDLFVNSQFVHQGTLRSSGISVPLKCKDNLNLASATMEEDRLATNLGPTADQNVIPEPDPTLKKPKRRFVGRRTADATARNTTPNPSIEESGAIQGVNSSHFTLNWNSVLTISLQLLNLEDLRVP